MLCVLATFYPLCDTICQPVSQSVCLKLHIYHQGSLISAHHTSPTHPLGAQTALCVYNNTSNNSSLTLRSIGYVRHCHVYFPENEKQQHPCGDIGIDSIVLCVYTLVNALQLNLRIACEWLVFNWFCGLAMKLYTFLQQSFSVYINDSRWSPFPYTKSCRIEHSCASRDMHNKCKRNRFHSHSIFAPLKTIDVQ